MTTIEGLLEAVFSVGSALRLYSEDTRPAEGSSVEDSQLREILQGWLRRDGAIVDT
jgi:hypothetical protein